MMGGDTSAFRRGLLHLANGLLLLGNAGLLFSAWDRLPECVPIHFDSRGTPDGWADKGPELLLLQLGLPALITALLYGSLLLVRFARRWPRMINIPNKREFLALSPAQQQPFWDLLTEMMAATGVAINILFLSVTSGMLAVATGGAARLNALTVFLPLGLLLAIALIYTVRMMVLPGELISTADRERP